MAYAAPANFDGWMHHTAGVWWIGRSGPAGAIRISSRDLAISPLHPFDPDDLVTPYRKLGWAQLWRGSPGVEWRFDLAEAPVETLEAIMDHCAAERDAPRIRLRYFWGGAWAREDFADGQSAARRLDTLFEWRALAWLGLPDRRVLPPSADGPPLIAKLLHRLYSDQDPLDDRGVWDRLSIFAHAPDSGLDTPVYVGLSSSLARIFGRPWARAMNAHSIRANWADGDHLPDRGYETAAAALYYEVRATGLPSRDRMVTPIETVHAPEPLWIGYQRLLVPQHGIGQPVLTATVIDPSALTPIPRAA